MKTISLNEYLNKDHPWANKLLSADDLRANRDIGWIELEYNIELYGELLKHEYSTMEEVKEKEWEIRGVSNDWIDISFGDNLFGLSSRMAREWYYNTIKNKVKKFLSEICCELGCGYGYNLSYINSPGYGGEYSKNAIKLGARFGHKIEEFNFYDASSYKFIEEDSVVFTAHAIEQLPDATPFWDGIVTQRDKIDYVIHFEPLYLESRHNLLGLLRNKYMVLNDYCRNLYPLLKSKKEIEILEFEQDVIGLNPLNPTSIIVWKFK